MRRVNEATVAGLRGHVAWFGHGPDDFIEVAVNTMAAGARRREKLVFIADGSLLARLRGGGGGAPPGRARVTRRAGFEQATNAADEMAEGKPTAAQARSAVEEVVELLLASGQLELAEPEAIYGAGPPPPADDLLVAFKDVLERALSDGYARLRVLADNTGFASGEEDAFDRWLTWEQVTDHFQAAAPVNGICYFDSSQVSPERQCLLAALHCSLAGDAPAPQFSINAREDGSSAVTGEVDALAADAFRRVVTNAPDHQALVLDLSRAGYLDHRALLALAEASSPTRPVIARNAPRTLQKLRAALRVQAPFLTLD